MRQPATACLLAAALLAGCISPLQRAERIAKQNGLEPLDLQGSNFEHRSFASTAPAAPSKESGLDPLVVFIEGDGSPWIHGGRQIASDPSSRKPLALELAVRTPGHVLYLGRPCYLLMSAKCSPDFWTARRYSADVVDSMVSALNRYVREHDFRQLLLVGYSGGGTLAVLMAARTPGVIGVVSIAGDLDPDAWVLLHHYAPLTGSLNPALAPALPTSLSQWYLLGDQDTNIPYASMERYLARVAGGDIRRFEKFDHGCCWVKEWPSIYRRIRGDLDQARAM